MSASAYEVFQGNGDFTANDTRLGNMNAMVVLESARVGFAQMDTTSVIFQLISKVPMGCFENGGLAVFENKTMSRSATSHSAVPQTAKGSLLRAGNHQVSTFRVATT